MIQVNLIGKEDNLYLHLHKGKLYVYENFDDWAAGFLIEDCVLKLMINGQAVLCDVRDGYLQNFQTVVE